MNTVATAVINFRAPIAKRDLIDHAVEVSGTNRTEFMLAALCEKAQEVLADQVNFAVSRKDFERFNELVEAPLSEANQQALRRLFSTPAPWER